MSDLITALFTEDELALLSLLDEVPTDIKSVNRQLTLIETKLNKHAIAMQRNLMNGAGTDPNEMTTKEWETLIRMQQLLRGKPTQIQTINNTSIAEPDLDNNELETLLRKFGGE